MAFTLRKRTSVGKILLQMEAHGLGGAVGVVVNMTPWLPTNTDTWEAWQRYIASLVNSSVQVTGRVFHLLEMFKNRENASGK